MSQITSMTSSNHHLICLSQISFWMKPRWKVTSRQMMTYRQTTKYRWMTKYRPMMMYRQITFTRKIEQTTIHSPMVELLNKTTTCNLTAKMIMVYSMMRSLYTPSSPENYSLSLNLMYIGLLVNVLIPS